MAMSRTQRCGHCEGCLAKACGICVYCKDNPQFGGPGVKKQSCVARRCTRVLESKLQREAIGLRAKAGCGYCEECRQTDCGVCLVCMDKRFFGGKFLSNALCAKKKCNNARNLETSPQQSPSPKHNNQSSFKAKHDHHLQHNNNGSVGLSSSAAMGGGASLLKKRLLSSNDALVGIGGANSPKKTKKTSDSGVPLMQHATGPYNVHQQQYSGQFVRNGDASGPLINGMNRASFMCQPPRPVYPSMQPSAPQVQTTNGYNGSPPAGTVAPATSVHSDFNNQYLQTSTHINNQQQQQHSLVNNGQHQPPPSYQQQLANSTNCSASSATTDLYSLYSFPSVSAAVGNNRLTASTPSSQPSQPPPYQWPPGGKVLDPMMSSAAAGASPNGWSTTGQQAHHFVSTTYGGGEHPMLRDRLTNAGNGFLHNHLQHQQSAAAAADDPDHLQYKLMQFYRNDKSHAYYNHNANGNQTLPGSIVTEPMGPMGQPKVILQQL